MHRRTLIKRAITFGATFYPIIKAFDAPTRQLIFNGPSRPVSIYNNWSAYDELSDVVPLTEELAMRELHEILRLKSLGAQFDYYVMDAFWFDKYGGYRIWHTDRWPNGPDKWINTCLENDIIPGLWFSVNNLIDSDIGHFLQPVMEWKDSISTDPDSLCLFRGGYLKHLSETLTMYAEKGIRMFKFDFANFGAATKEAEENYVKSEIIEKNKSAFIDVLKQLRSRFPGIMLIGYNGFGGEMSDTFTPYHRSVEQRWLEVFDTLYCGDPRFSDVPAMNIWRSMDIYSDHMVSRYLSNGIPVNRIDNCGFMVGTTGTCYKRAKNAWKGMQILELARGGWVNVFHGNLELFTKEDAAWFAKTQQMYLDLQRYGHIEMFGNVPGERKEYGFHASSVDGSVLTVVNPSQTFVNLILPVSNESNKQLLFSDGGFKPVLKENIIRLGPEQMAIIGTGKYASNKYSLGIDELIVIPKSIEQLNVQFTDNGHNTVKGIARINSNKNIRIIFQQFTDQGFPYRTRAGGPPKGTSMENVFIIKAVQGGKDIPVHIQYDKIIWSGLSWASGEIKFDSLRPDISLEIECKSKEVQKLIMKPEVYAVSY